MLTVEVPKSSKIFLCKICDYNTTRKCQFDRHLLTRKHEILTNPYKQDFFICECGKKYKHASSLSRHKIICRDKKKEEVEKEKKGNAEEQNNQN